MSNKRNFVACQQLFIDKVIPIRKGLLSLLNQMNNWMVTGTGNAHQSGDNNMLYSPLLEEILEEDLSDKAVQQQLEFFSQHGLPWENLQKWLEEKCTNAQTLQTNIQTNIKKSE